jgi:2-octaprenyl-6-methoxyphenol hydroxylase
MPTEIHPSPDTLPASAGAADVRDLAIVGGGPVGLALACQLLRTTSWRLTLIDAATPARAARDPRAIALSWGSRQLLEQIGAWPVAGSPIEHIHVSQRGHFGHVKLHHEDYGVPALGYVVRYGDLCAVLERALAQASQAAPGRLARAFDTRIDTTTQDGQTVQLAGTVHAGHESHPYQLATTIAVQAEGGLFHEQAADAGRGAQRRDYGQTAIIGHVAASRPQPGWAWERFTADGPLALLPYDEHGEGNGGGYALVWCCSPEEAARRLALPEAAFAAELREMFGARLGSFTLLGKRHAYALGLNAAPVTVDRRVVAVGNAAQTLHPVAGQGLNLGLRDAFALADGLRAACTPQTLEAFAARHRVDRALTIGVTDMLPRVFGVPGALAGHARGAGLAAMACLSPLKDALARQMMFGMRR